MKKIRVLFCPVDRKPYIVGITDTMKTIEMAVGGKAKAVKMLSEPHVLMICNRQNAGELNRNLPDMTLFGRAGGEAGSQRRCHFLRSERKGLHH